LDDLRWAGLLPAPARPRLRARSCLWLL
jgi:hypothetical protein